MRVRLRILVFRGNKRLSKSELGGETDPLMVGIRYILEFKYLEATKWLMVAGDCQEKYILLGLLNLSLGQEESAREFLETAKKFGRRDESLRFFVSYDDSTDLREIRSPDDIAVWHT